MLVCLNGTDGLRGMLSGDARDAYCLEAGVLQHLVEVFVDLGAIWSQVGLGPGTSIGVRVADSDQLSTRSLLQEVAGVTGAHSAEARDSDLELANHACFVWCLEEGTNGKYAVVNETLEEKIRRKKTINAKQRCLQLGEL